VSLLNSDFGAATLVELLGHALQVLLQVVLGVED